MSRWEDQGLRQIKKAAADKELPSRPARPPVVVPPVRRPAPESGTIFLRTPAPPDACRWGGSKK
jgi:hypothetical protein